MAQMPEMLTVEEVLHIHRILEQDFSGSIDPISPPGVKSLPLLESAIGRQFVSLDGTPKYPNPVANAATLTYGICCDHAFHNGNKRTALVAMLVHLDKNRLCLYNVREVELYQLMISIADHTIGLRPDPRRPDRPSIRRSADEEVAALRAWLDRRVDRVRRGERLITYRQLRAILGRFGFELAVKDSNTVDVIKKEQVSSLIFFRRSQKVREIRVGSIGYRDEGTEVSVRDIKNVRKWCRLQESDGVDTDSFYDGADMIDAFVNKYRTVLRRLART